MGLKKRIDPALFELCLGIVVYGAVFEAVLLCFSRKISYSAGLWCGIAAALLSAVHMYLTLNRSMEMLQKSAVAKVTANNIVRYVILAAGAAAIARLDMGSFLFAFFGYMGMKASAYLSPLMKRANARFFKVGR